MPNKAPQKPLPKKSRFKLPERVFKSKIADFALGFGGVMLAAASAYFPWYVHNNSDQFHPPRMVFTGQPEELDPGIDPITTASIPKQKNRVILGKKPDQGFVEKAQRRVREISMKKPEAFVGDGSITVLFASRGRALVDDDGEIVMVEPGMVLSNGSKVTKVTRAGKSWIITTSDEKTLAWKQ